MNNISVDLVAELIIINTSVLEGKLNHPAQLAIKLEEMAAQAWSEAEQLGCPSFEEASGLPPCIQIQP